MLIDHQLHAVAHDLADPVDATPAGSAMDAQHIDVLTLVGDLDIYSAPMLRERLRAIIGDDLHDVVIDVSQVPVLDSMGLGVLVGGLKRARLAGGTVRLAGPTAMTRKVLGITGLAKVFEVYPDAAAALVAPRRDVGD